MTLEAECLERNWGEAKNNKNNEGRMKYVVNVHLGYCGYIDHWFTSNFGGANRQTCFFGEREGGNIQPSRETLNFFGITYVVK